MKSDSVTLKLTRSQALVLFDWLSRSDESLPVSDPSEEKILWFLEGQLEQALVEPLEPDYQQALARARKEVNEGR